MLLGSTKTETDEFLGKPVMARNIFGLTGKEPIKYRQGDFDVVVGFLNDLARYCASVRRSGPLKELSPPELSMVLSLNAPAALWSVEAFRSAREDRCQGQIDPKATQPLRTTYLRYVERDPNMKEKVVCEIVGWMPATEGIRIFLPSRPGGAASPARYGMGGKSGPRIKMPRRVHGSRARGVNYDFVVIGGGSAGYAAARTAAGAGLKTCCHRGSP